MKEKCDFCHSSEVTKKYSVADFRTSVGNGSVIVVSEGDYLVCKTCDELIESKKEKELCERSARLLKQAGCFKETVSDKLIAEIVKALYEGFLNNVQEKR